MTEGITRRRGAAGGVMTGPATQNINFVVPVEEVKRLVANPRKLVEKPVALEHETETPEKIQRIPSPDSLYFSDKEYPDLKARIAVADWIEALKIINRIVARNPVSPWAYFMH